MTKAAEATADVGRPGILNYAITGLLAVVMLELPVIQFLRFARHDFYPWTPETSFFLSITTWAFLHSVLVAWGALRVRAKPGREHAHSYFLVPVLVQAAIWLLLWSVLMPLSHLGSRPAFEPGPIYLILCLYWFFGGPVVAGLQALCSRRILLLVLGQLVPLAYLVFSLVTGLAFIT